jgi:hypothetical protein
MKSNLVVGLLATIVILLALYGLDQGIYVGSSITPSTGGGMVTKKCRYLSLRGISEVPAQGGRLKSMPGTELKLPGREDEPDHLFCRLFAA